jgi:mannose-6-phosphate isomerase class I
MSSDTQIRFYHFPRKKVSFYKRLVVDIQSHKNLQLLFERTLYMVRICIQRKTVSGAVPFDIFCVVWFAHLLVIGSK